MTATEEELTFASGDVTLAGTLVRCPDSRGVVVFAHGSGPQDRNQNVGVQRLDVFNALADAAGAAGFSSLRYDKRGCGASSGSYELHRLSELVADLRAAMDLVRPSGLGPVYLCGHSEGTLLAPMAAEGQDVAGLILLCPFVTDMQEILIWQAEAGDALRRQVPGIKGLIAGLFALVFGSSVTLQRRIVARILATEDSHVRFMRKTIPVNWLRDLIRADSRAIHGANRRPTLLLVARKDIQCPPGDGAAIKALCPQADLTVVPDLTHLLRINPGPPGLANSPAEMARPMAPVVAETVVGWLNAQAAGQAARS